MTSYARTAAVLAAVLVAAGCGSDSDQSGSAGARDDAADNRRLTKLEKRAERLQRELDAREELVVEDEVDTGRDGKVLAASDVRALQQFMRGLGGRVGASVGLAGEPSAQSLGELETGAAWSTIKVPIALRIVADAGGPDALNAHKRNLIERAVRASDNAAAAALWDSLGAAHGGPEGAAAAVGEVLAAAGDNQTEVSTVGRGAFSPYGQTEWTLAAQHQFMSALGGGCLADAQTSAYLLEAMGAVVGAQRWGMGSASRPVAFKGGWGPEPGGSYLVRQMGLWNYAPGRGAFVVALAAQAHDGSFESGQRILTAIAQWLSDHLPATAPPMTPC